MKARLVSLQGTIEAEGTPEELAKFFREYNGWTLSGAASYGTLGPIQFTPAPVNVPAWIAPVTLPGFSCGVTTTVGVGSA